MYKWSIFHSSVSLPEASCGCKKCTFSAPKVSFNGMMIQPEREKRSGMALAQVIGPLQLNIEVKKKYVFLVYERWENH